MKRLVVLAVSLMAMLYGSWAAAQTLSESTYRRLTRIHEHIGEEEYKDALQKLDKLLPSTKYSEYEQAMVLQTYGFVYAQTGDYKKAASYFQKAIDLGALPEQQVESMKFNLGQFHIAVEQYREGVKVLEEYFRTAKNPIPPAARLLISTAYAQLKQYRKALPHITKAIQESKDPKEPWFQLKLALHYELKDYRNSAKTLLQMISRFPVKQDYWKQLSGVFLQLKQDKDALAILNLAERRGLIDEGKEIVNLANMFLYLDIPYKGGKVLDAGLRSGAVEKTDKNYELLANAWLGAREYDRAITALEQAAKRTDDGEMVLRLAFLYVEKEAWAKVPDTLAKARKLGVKKPGDAALLQGIAATELGRYEEAIKAFVAAMKHEDTREQAAAWQQHALALQAETASDS